MPRVGGQRESCPGGSLQRAAWLLGHTRRQVSGQEGAAEAALLGSESCFTAGHLCGFRSVTQLLRIDKKSSLPAPASGNGGDGWMRWCTYSAQFSACRARGNCLPDVTRCLGCLVRQSRNLTLAAVSTLHFRSLLFSYVICRRNFETLLKFFSRRYREGSREPA